MTNLAIKGHPTRGREVIDLLEMFGGKYEDVYKGTEVSWVYIVNKKGFIDWDYPCAKYEVFSLEEFLEKFPYKIGDKVIVKGYKQVFKIRSMRWCSERNDMMYSVSNGWFYTEELQPYKEETMEKTIKIDIPNGYEFTGFDDDNHQVVFKKIGCQYPKTYEECCNVLKIEYPYFKTEEDGISASTYKNKLFGDLKQLLICRDAYWKIAGEQMGLEKPWEPKKAETVYAIVYDFYDEVIDVSVFDLFDNAILVFPTAEMQDAFYENFKDLIEQCKELL